MGKWRMIWLHTNMQKSCFCNMWPLIYNVTGNNTGVPEGRSFVAPCWKDWWRIQPYWAVLYLPFWSSSLILMPESETGVSLTCHLHGGQRSAEINVRWDYFKKLEILWKEINRGFHSEEVKTYKEDLITIIIVHMIYKRYVYHSDRLRSSSNHSMTKSPSGFVCWCFCATFTSQTRSAYSKSLAVSKDLYL